MIENLQWNSARIDRQTPGKRFVLIFNSKYADMV